MSINPIFTSSNKKSTEKNNNALRASVKSHGATRITETLEHAFKENNHHNSFHLPQPSMGISTEFNEYVD